MQHGHIAAICTVNKIKEADVMVSFFNFVHLIK